MDESVIYSSVFDLSGQRRVRERREHQVTTSLHSVVKSAANRENRASFRCDLVVVQWNSSRLFAIDFFLASWKSWFLFKPAKLRVLSI